MVCRYGMKTMSYRTTFALNRETIGRLKHLSGVWQVSQAEVVRRAISMADEHVKTEPDATSMLRALHASGNVLVREQAEAYLAEVQDQRSSWRGEE